MTILDIPDDDVLSQMILYDDNNMVVTLTDQDLINCTVITSIVSYYKKSNHRYEKICELRVPRSPSLSPLSSPVSSNKDTKILEEELDGTLQLNLNQNQNYSVLNWADEISYEEPTNIPHWALIPGLDFNQHNRDGCSGRHRSTTEDIDNSTKIHHPYVINWADEPVYDGPVDVPDWALIPGLDYDRHIDSVAQEHVDDSDQLHHKYVNNWAEEPVYEGDVDIPTWALIPGFKFNVSSKTIK